MKNKWQGKSVDFRIARKKDIPAIAQLYTACFGDDSAEAEEFLHTFFWHPDFRLLLAAKNKSAVSMLAMIPARLAKGRDCFYRGFYLYGIGTFPSFRGQGLSKDLMGWAKSLASSLNYDFLFVVPASESLISFYEKQGFFTASPAEMEKSSCHFPNLSSQAATISTSRDLAPNPLDSTSLTAISLEEYLALRTNLENVAGMFSLMEPFRTYALEMIQEHLHFYKEISSTQKTEATPGQQENGICFYSDSIMSTECAHSDSIAKSKHMFEFQKRPRLQLLEQTGPSFTLSGGLVHQIFPLRRLSLPSSTYFQFPMDEMSSLF